MYKRLSLMQRLPMAAMLLFLAALLTAPATAQAQRAGYISQEAILAQMPEMQQAQQQLQQEIQSERQELQTQQQQLQQQVQTYQERREMLTEESRQEREQELQQQQQQLQQTLEQRDQEIAQRERELMQPIFERFQSAVDAVAQQRDLDFVIRDQALLYVNDTQMVDLTEAVASQLGVSLSNGAPQSSGR